jgi:GTP-binding protein YchF
LELGIIGLPTASKTTIFNALTRGERPVAASAAGKMQLLSVVVEVPDARVDRLSALFQPRKTTYAKVTYTDIAGLDQGGVKKGLSGLLRNQIMPMDAFVHVVRAFRDEMVPHLLGSVDPQRDVEVLDQEMILADLAMVENRLDRLGEGLRKGSRPEERPGLLKEQALFEWLRASLEGETLLRDLDLTPEQAAAMRGFGFLTLKPVLVVVNTGDEERAPREVLRYEHKRTALLALRGRLEMEIAQLPPEEAPLFMEEFGIAELALNRIIEVSYDLVGVHSFFTVGEDEVRAWTVRQGATAVEAAGAIHTDLSRGFIRAEVVSYTDLITAGGLVEARKAGRMRLEGKEYVVQDGDIVHVRFST